MKKPLAIAAQIPGEVELDVASPKDVKEILLDMINEAESFERGIALDVLANIKAIGMAAKDLHYRAKGDASYSEHLLADVAWKIDDLTDDFIEVYFMGDKGWDAPLMDRIYNRASVLLILAVDEEKYGTEFFARRLLEVCEKASAMIEDAKLKLIVKSGTQAVLDDISKQILKVIGLLNQNLKKSN